MSDCWLFLNCEIMTGYPPESCPNQESCKQQSHRNGNRYCFMPYYVYSYKNCGVCDVPTLIVDAYVEEAAQDFGYHPAFILFYTYINNCLIIGQNDAGNYMNIPDNAQKLGFSRPEEIPYTYKKFKKYGVLTVTVDSEFFRNLGWCEAIKLQYEFHHDLDIGKFLLVKFDRYRHSQYEGAVSKGWYPPDRWWPKVLPVVKEVVQSEPSIQSEPSNDGFDPDEIPF